MEIKFTLDWKLFSIIQSLFILFCFLLALYYLQDERTIYTTEESLHHPGKEEKNIKQNVEEQLANLEKRFEKQLKERNNIKEDHIPYENEKRVVEKYIIQKEDIINFDQLCLPVKKFKYVSYYESLGWFNIPDEEWQIMKRYHSLTRFNQLECTNCFQRSKREYTNFNWKPSFICPYPTLRIGYHDGGKNICHPCRLREAKENCLVYSVGSNGQWQFEESVLKWNSNCEIHTFDFDFFVSPFETNFHMYGLGDEDFTDSDKHVYKTLPTIVQELGHEDRVINILKIDCEGCEFLVFEQFWKANIEIQQIVIETHFGVNKNETQTNLFMEEMHKHGFVMIFKEANSHGSNGRFAEITWLKFNETIFY